MGQYYKVFNKTKKEYLNPHSFGNGLKLMEFTSDGKGLLQCLSLLLAEGNGRGGGDHPSKSPLIGSWSGDQITIQGDYADDTIWDQLQKKDHEGNKNPKYVKWTDISMDIYRVLLEDSWIALDMKNQLKEHGTKYLFGDEKELMKELFPLECHEGDLRQEYEFKPKTK
tara:strand:+ start:481 stop:984 length:504 start_codon:yes stop_codon:yes gene_type:complete